MANKKSSRVKLSKTSKPRHRSLLVALAFVGVVAVLFAGWYFLVRNETLYTPKKETVKADVQRLLSAASLKGTEVYSELTDKGCSSNGVGLKIWTWCSFTGWKYYKHTGTLAQDLKAADTQIIEAGWRRTFNSQNATDLDVVLGEENRQAVTYRNPLGSSSAVVNLGYYKDSTKQSDAEIGNLISAGKIEAPKEAEYIYGVRVNASYWSCSNESLFKFCPVPPSKPHF